jgi:peptidyl-tRNA hydrolase
LGTDKFWRIRVGIGRPIQNSKSVEEYVLKEFEEDELGKLKVMLKKAVEAIKLALKNGPQKAMNMYN